MKREKKLRPLRQTMIFALCIIITFFAAIIILYPQTLLGALFAIAMTVLMHIVVSRLLITPIEHLSRSLGSRSTFIPLDESEYEGSEEVQALAQTINEMIERAQIIEQMVLKSTKTIDIVRSILDGVDALLCVTDLKTDEFLYINEKMRNHYGLGYEIVGQKCYQVLQSDMASRCLFCPLDQLLKKPSHTISWEYTSTINGKSYRNTDCLIDWADGKKAHLQHSIDITDMKLTEQKLSRQLAQQQLMSDISQSFISSNDKSTLINNALRMAGEFMQLAKVALFHIEDITLVCSGQIEYEWCDLLSGVTPTPDNVKLHYSKHGTIYKSLVENRAPFVTQNNIIGSDEISPLRDPLVKSFILVPIYIDGAFWGTLSFNDRNSNRIWTEGDTQLVRMISSIIGGVILRDRTQSVLIRMSSVAESSPYLVAHVNQDGVIEYANQGAANLSGYTIEELISNTIYMFFDDESLAHLRQVILPVIQTEGFSTFEIPLICKDGKRKVVSTSMFRSGDQTSGFGIIASDMTEKLQMQSDLIAAKEQAEEASIAKGNFLARMSHEMRTPMNAIIGMTNIAQNADDPERKEYCLEKISDASRHLLGIINDVLDMSKIEANKFELVDGEFDFERMLMRVIDVVNFRVDERHQQLCVKLDSNIPRFLVADEQRLSQVITNLMSNAVKFTPDHGSITLSADVIACAGSVYRLRFGIADTGIGITKEQLSRLFHSFEQANGGISRKFGGTGLGLAISKRIVELMNGRIWVDSTINVGSTFFFEIEMRKGSNIRSSYFPPDVTLSNLRILAVDDDPDVLDYFRTIMKAHNIHCETATGGYSALSMIKHAKKPFNIVFTDWHMPDMDGVKLAQRIRKLHGGNIVVVMISAVEWSHIEKEARASGVTRFISKPLFASVINNCISECLGLNTPHATKEALDVRNYSGKHLLIVDDIEINREIVITLLESTGIAISCAENGREALELVSADPAKFDMVFMDVHMPEMDGLEATRRIREIGTPHARSLPIVAMTANVFREDVERCLAAGINEHTGKPIDKDEMMAKLDKYLYQAR